MTEIVSNYSPTDSPVYYLAEACDVTDVYARVRLSV